MEKLSRQTEVLLSPEEQERTKRAVCAFFESKFTELKVTARSGRLDYTQRFYELCSGSHRPWMTEKEFDLLGLPMPFRLRFDRHSEYTPELHKMTIDINPLLKACDPTALEEASVLIMETVHHEAEHIFFPGELEELSVDYSDNTEAVKYLSKDSEINAYARQFAFRYHAAYPNEPFSLKKMETLISTLRSSNVNAYTNYFISFANPVTQQKWQAVADLARVHTAIVAQTEEHLEKLKRQR